MEAIFAMEKSCCRKEFLPGQNCMLRREFLPRKNYSGKRSFLSEKNSAVVREFLPQNYAFGAERNFCQGKIIAEILSRKNHALRKEFCLGRIMPYGGNFGREKTCRKEGIFFQGEVVL